LRDQAVLESQHEGFHADLDLTQAAAQRLTFRDEFAASRKPYLLLDPPPRGHATTEIRAATEWEQFVQLIRELPPSLVVSP